MGWFEKSVTCEDIGVELARRCLSTIRTIPADESSKMRDELKMLTMNAYHSGVICHIHDEKMKRVITTFYAEIDKGMDIRDLRTAHMKRGEIYWKILSHNLDDPGSLCQSIATHLAMFYSGGAGEDGSFVIPEIPLLFTCAPLAATFFLTPLVETTDYLVSIKERCR